MSRVSSAYLYSCWDSGSKDNNINSGVLRYWNPVRVVELFLVFDLVFEIDDWKIILTPHVLSEWMVEVCRF